MRAISLWQPWAILVPIGAKKYETRSWSTDYRGKLIIQAAKRFSSEQKRLCNTEPFKTCLERTGIHQLSSMPLGVALGIVDLVAIYQTQDIIHFINDQELAFGNFQPGRFAWQLKNPRRFPEPIPMRGYQGLWKVDTQNLSIKIASKLGWTEFEQSMEMRELLGVAPGDGDEYIAHVSRIPSVDELINIWLKGRD